MEWGHLVRGCGPGKTKKERLCNLNEKLTFSAIFTGQCKPDFIHSLYIGSTTFLLERLQLHKYCWDWRGAGQPAYGPVRSIGKSCWSFQREKERLFHWSRRPWRWVQEHDHDINLFGFQVNGWATLWSLNCATNGQGCLLKQTHLLTVNCWRKKESVYKIWKESFKKKGEKSQWLPLQGALCQCVSLHPEVSDEGEVWGYGGPGHQRDAGQGGEQRQVPRQQPVQECSRSNCGQCPLPPSLHPAGRLGLSHGWLLQLGRRGGWTGHPTINTMASGQDCPQKEASLKQACHLNCTHYISYRLTFGWCWLNFLTLTRRLCLIWWPGLGMTTPLTLKRTWSLWKRDPDVL